MGGCFSENRYVVLFWKLPGKGASDGFWNEHLRECLMFGNGINNVTHTGQCCVALVTLATICWPSLGFAEAVALVCLVFFDEHHLS